MPTLMIVDKLAEPVKLRKTTKSIQKEDPNMYFKKYQATRLFLDENFVTEAKDFIEAYIDDKLKMKYISQERSNNGATRVKEVSGGQFISDYVENPNI